MVGAQDPHSSASSSCFLLANSLSFEFAGKNWHSSKKAFRPNGGLTSYAKRVEARKQQETVKEHEKELREEKEAERQVGNRSFSAIDCPVLCSLKLITVCRRIFNGSRNAEPQRKRRSDTRKWLKRCIINGSSG